MAKNNEKKRYVCIASPDEDLCGNETSLYIPIMSDNFPDEFFDCDNCDGSNEDLCPLSNLTDVRLCYKSKNHSLTLVPVLYLRERTDKDSSPTFSLELSEIIIER